MHVIYRCMNNDNIPTTEVKPVDSSEVKLQRRCRQLERQIGRLKEIIRLNLATEMSPKIFAQMSCQQIVQYLNKKKQQENAESKR